MEGDKFVSSAGNKPNVSQNKDNFFLGTENSTTPFPVEPARHLNDYDFNILREDAYKDVSDQLFKLEYKISRIEKEIAETEQKIQAAKEIHDFITAENLIANKKILEEDLKSLSEMYNDSALSAKISSGITLKIQKRIANIKKAAGSISETILSHLPGKFSSFMQIKNSLNKLENINKSVDELMAIANPYGQYGDKYEQLSRYILKANSIQAEISKYFR